MAGVTVESATCWMLGVSYEEYKNAGYKVPDGYLTDDMYITFWINPLVFKIKAIIDLIRSTDIITEKKDMIYGTVKAKEFLSGENVQYKELYCFLNSVEMYHPMSEIAKEEGLPQMAWGFGLGRSYESIHAHVFVLHKGEKVPEVINSSMSMWKSEKNPELKRGESFDKYRTFHDKKEVGEHDAYICTIKTSDIPNFIKKKNK